MGRSSGSSPSPFSSLLHFILSLAPLFFLSSSVQTPFKEVSLENPVVEFVPSLYSGHSCERIQVIGTSRVNLKPYASSVHVALKASGGIPERLQGKIEVCHHRNVSMGICQCENDDWKTLQKGQWSAVISPYEKRYIDIKSKKKLPGSVTVIVEEEFQQWRLICLGSGFLLIILAPRISTWVPFYVCSSMAVGVLGVVLVLAFQLMKLLPMGRKNTLYITLCGSVLGAGSYILQHFSTVVNSILVNFGLSEEMHYPVSAMLLVLIVLSGAALGYWIVRKFVISEDGSVDAGIAHFVKWAMRVLGVVSVLQSSLDNLLPVIALGIYGCICFLLKKWQNRARFQLEHSGNELWQPSHERIRKGKSIASHGPAQIHSGKIPLSREDDDSMESSSAQHRRRPGSQGEVQAMWEQALAPGSMQETLERVVDKIIQKKVDAIAPKPKAKKGRWGKNRLKIVPKGVEKAKPVRITALDVDSDKDTDKAEELEEEERSLHEGVLVHEGEGEGDDDVEAVIGIPQLKAIITDDTPSRCSKRQMTLRGRKNVQKELTAFHATTRKAKQSLPHTDTQEDNDVQAGRMTLRKDPCRRLHLADPEASTAEEDGERVHDITVE